jgi:hypothetical protein
MKRIANNTVIANLIDIAIFIVIGILFVGSSQQSYCYYGFCVAAGYNYGLLLPGLLLIFVGLIPVYALFTLLTAIVPAIRTGNFALVRDGAAKARRFTAISKTYYGQLQSIAESLAPGYPTYGAGPLPPYPPPPPP